MSINTLSAFLYGYNVDSNNFLLPFQEGAIEYLAEVRTRGYTLTDLVTEIARSLNATGQNEYTVTVDRSTRLITISADGNFDLLLNSIYSSTDVYSLLGFTGSDRVGLSSYEGDTATGEVYEPQFVLQNYTPFIFEKRAVDSTKNQAASGNNVENIKFGDFNIMTCNIRHITNNFKIRNAPVQNNSNGVEDYLDFINYVTDLLPVEFIPDKSDFDTFDEALIESTPEAKDGTNFRVKPMRGYFTEYESGTLTFRRI